MKRHKRALAILVAFIAVVFIIAFVQNRTNSQQKKTTIAHTTVMPTPTEKPRTYTHHTIAKKRYYTIVMVGDSMTEALGPHGGKLSEILNTQYKSIPGNQKIVIDNYAKGGLNVLSLHETLNTISAKPFDLILIESFGYNPLSHLPLEEGLKKQNETLDAVMQTILKKHPDAVIVFVATIAPNKETYAKGASPGKTIPERVAQAEERMTYIKNHLEYAKAHNIPFIDIYNKSLTPEGNGKLVYINPSDNIHPSFAGINFISQEIADYIYTNKLLEL